MKLLRASSYFQDTSEKGFVILTAKSVIEFSVHSFTRFAFDYEIYDGYFVCLHAGFFSVGITSIEGV